MVGVFLWVWVKLRRRTVVIQFPFLFRICFNFFCVIWLILKTYLLVGMVQLRLMVVELLVETVRIRRDKLHSNISVLKKERKYKSIINGHLTMNVWNRENWKFLVSIVVGCSIYMYMCLLFLNYFFSLAIFDSQVWRGRFIILFYVLCKFFFDRS